MRDGIWTPKPAGAVGRITGLFSTTGERILANGQIPRLSHNNLQMFIPGGRNNS
jgi:hypothetical protein